MLHLLTLLALAAPSAPPAPTWEETLARVSPAVVSIRFTATRNFDTETAAVAQGTGFVIDAEHGIILTNRHMVTPGPVRAEAIFLDNEEVTLEPLYRDPVHDFGFYRFDPKAVKYQAVTALPLVPSAARTGLEIRVIGNDAGEKISILDGTLARLDRAAPDYGEGNYNDFNTFYYQAASNTSGGSSGSPVIDVRGQVVALNAGGNTRAASSFYLPLDRVVPAFQAIVAGKPVPRGTWQTELLYTPYDELVRLGLTPEAETEARRLRPDATGLLVVRDVTPAGPGDGLLHPGDVLLRVDGRPIADFVSLESGLDASVGRSVKVELQRGGQPVTVDVPVGDLHAVTPDEYLELSRGVLHALSYQEARSLHLPVRGVRVAATGHMLSAAGVPGGSVITHVDGVPVDDLDAMQAALEGKADGQRMRLRFHLSDEPESAHETVAVMDRKWYPMRRCVREDVHGTWPCTDSPPPPPAPPVAPAGPLPMPPADKPGDVLASSLVYVDFDIPYPTAGVQDMNFAGVGTVVDAARGLVLVDRDTVPVTLGDLMLTFAGAVRVPAELVYLHPTHNFAVLRYDPKLLGDLPVHEVTLLDALPAPGDRVWHVGLNSDHELVVSETKVDTTDALIVEPSNTPTFRDANLTGIGLDEAKDSLGGVVADKKGRVYGLWASFYFPNEGDRAFYGLPSAYLAPVIDALRAGQTPVVRGLGFEAEPLPLAQARDRGLSDARLRQLAALSPARPRVLEITRTWGGTPAGAALRDTDLLLTLDGEPVTRMEQLEAAAAREHVEVLVLRDGQEQTVKLDTVPLDGTGVTRVVSWAGMLLHDQHREIAAQRGRVSDGVYVGWLWFGSPASRYGVRATSRILAVNDEPTPDLDAFYRVVSRLSTDSAPVRLKILDLHDREQVVTLKLDLAYWETSQITRTDGRWVRTTPGKTP